VISTPLVQGFQPGRLLIAVVVGALSQSVLLAFSLYASLVLARISFGSHHLYWALSGVYMVLGVALSLLIVPWHRLVVRVLVAVLMVVPFCVFALFFHWN
jgi:hypothetical protein